ncbi:MAG TPA: class I SAM-dependent methyltransferase [Acidimicrobiales bacterium]|jgi:SAM-dependent methyltransferase
MASERERRLVFGEDPERYDRARPAYPEALVDQLVAWVGAGARVVDVGCGTGKATGLLAARGMRGVGVEPHPAMAAVARRNLADRPGWRIDESGFEDWAPRPGDTPADLVTCAQAWHWLDPGVRLHKAHALLRPGGWLALWWNADAPDDSPVRRAVLDVYDRLEPGMDVLPSCGNLPRPGPDDPIPDGLGFGESVDREIHWSVTYTTAEWIDLLQTHSNHRLLPADRLGRLLDEVAAALDDQGGSYTYRYRCVLWAAPRDH